MWAETTPSNADEEAMARARRQAENPMRRILEAGRITVRRRVVVEAAEAAAAAPTEPATVATKPATTTPESAQAGGEIRPTTSVAPSAVRVTIEPLAPEASQAAVDERAVPTRSLALPLPTPALSGSVAVGGAAATGRDQPTRMPREGGQDREASLRLPSPATKPTPQVPVFKTMEWAPDQPPDGERPANPQPLPVDRASPSTLSMPRTEPPHAPHLRSFVEPALNDRLRDELGRVDVVTVDLALNADGTVQDTVFQTRVPAGVRRAMQSALLQWRYDALPGPTTHRVEVVFER
ncbi:MAG: hypothetical protein H6933_19860 [Burkholderiaceae bacterium]|nr:hypothetical protein [Burkholderiaceae bacterium]